LACFNWLICGNLGSTQELELPLYPDSLSQDEAQALSIAAGSVFQPRAPVSTREFFAGRWEQLTTVADAVAQKGLHIVIFGERVRNERLLHAREEHRHIAKLHDLVERFPQAIVGSRTV
jgi:hypothetical protein